MLPVQFTVMTIAGIWCPPDCSSIWIRIIYKLYSFIVNILMYTLGIFQLARLIFVKQSFSEFNDTFFILLSTNFTCIKAACHLLIQKRVINLTSMFKEDCCIVQSDTEFHIQKKYDDLCRKMSIALLTLVEFTGLTMIAAPLNGGIETRELIYKVLLPYDLSNPVAYWFSFLHQSIAALLWAAIGIINDALIAGFMLQVCGQLEILAQRIREIPTQVTEALTLNKPADYVQALEKRLLKEKVKHHVHIFKIADALCKTFYEIVVCQFLVSALAICVSVYQISVGTSNKVELITFVLYLVCMLQQLFVYCYFGSEVTIQSKNIAAEIFGIDWSFLSLELIKDLTIMIHRASKSIEISCGPFIHLSLDSFTYVVRLSYSIFNVLSQSTKSD